MKAKANRQDRPVRRAHSESEPQVESLERLRELEAYAGTGPALTGGDLDADWQRAASSGEILRNRDRRYWDLERKAADDKRSS